MNHIRRPPSQSTSFPSGPVKQYVSNKLLESFREFTVSLSLSGTVSRPDNSGFLSSALGLFRSVDEGYP